jgi:phosphoribosylformylglycinamidine synthase
MSIPVIGGKVSFYNETTKGTIKPTPVIGSIGLIEGERNVLKSNLKPADSIFIIGMTHSEMGGSEFFESFHHFTGGRVPRVYLDSDLAQGNVLLELIRSNTVNCAHDCSKGGLAVGLSELALISSTGISVNLERIPSNCTRLDSLLFSETHSRYLFSTNRPSEAIKILNRHGCAYSLIGYAIDNAQIEFRNFNKKVVEISLTDATRSYEHLSIVMEK